jgi:uncharacterized membrane protein SirB2
LIEFYPWIKLLHMSCAWLSLSGFLLRGFWSLRESPQLKHPLARKLPILVDSTLLLSALCLATLSSQWPFQQAWLSAKLLGLLVYILLGMIALHWGRTRLQRGIGLAAALMVFIYLLSVATQRSPTPWVGM